jgi:triosephosphate isomerase
VRRSISASATRRSTCSTARSRGASTPLTAEQLGLLVIAYEPVWAIGTGRNATPAQAADAHSHIRQRLRQWFGNDAADQCHVIYGGSVKPDNISDLVTQKDVDGALVGGASLDVRGFSEIVSKTRGAPV